MRGDVILSLLLTKSQPNFPLMHVDIPFAGDSGWGCTFSISLPLVHISNEQPTPQYVQTVLVFFIRDFLILDSELLMAIIGLMVVSGSMDLTASIILSFVSPGMPVMNPDLPSMDFSMRAFTGHTVTQCPHETQDESFMGTSLSHITRGRSRLQSILRVSFTCTSWHASTHLPHSMHWFGS